jgi:hypothetical protein
MEQDELLPSPGYSPVSNRGTSSKPKRPWLTFSVRTLLLCVALAAVAAWIGRDVAAAVQRHAARRWLQQIGGSAESLADWNRQHLLQQPDAETVSFIQTWLGDEAVVEVTLPSMATTAEIERARSVFPEAQFIHVAEPPSPNFF